MESVVKIVDVLRNETRNGNTRFTVRDADGREYVTFRPPIGEVAERCKSKAARIEFHEEERNGSRNVYLDRIEPTQDASDRPADNADAAAWETAAEAAPLIVGDEQVSGEELFEALKPFKDRVADDIRHNGRLDEREDEDPADVLPFRKGTKRATK